MGNGNKPDLAALVARLRRVRVDRGDPQDVIARQAGLSLATVQRIEGGSQGVAFSAFLAYWHALDLPPLIDLVPAIPQPQPPTRRPRAVRRSRR